MLALYNILAVLLWPVLWLYPPFRGTIRQRLGRFELNGYNPDKPGLKFLVNAVSAGEVVAISSYLSELKRAAPDSQTVLLTTTDSGQEMAQKKAAESFDLLAYFPLIDLPFVVKRYLDRLKPDVYITTESELWPNIQRQCSQRGIPVILVNARIYLHNKKGLRGAIVRQLYDQVDKIVCQDELQRERFIRFGLPEEQLSVSGNIKFDFELPEWDESRLGEWKSAWGTTDSSVVVAGSTHEGEEQLLIDAYEQAKAEQQGRKVKLILAPRHIERVPGVLQLATGAGLRAVTMTQAEQDRGGDWDVLVVDRYGILADVYRLADLVVMGGTFHPKVGGHNLLEATILRKIVIAGPYTYSIESQMEMLRAGDAVIECALDPAGDHGKLAEIITESIVDHSTFDAIGERAYQLTVSNRGAARRAVEITLAELK